MSEAQVIHVSEKPEWTHTLTATRLSESAGARCKDCWWGAAGPWALVAAFEHIDQTGHQRFKFRGIKPALTKD